MGTMKDKLREISSKRSSDWVRTESLFLTGSEKKITYGGRSPYIQVDMDLMGRMFEAVSKSAEKISKFMLKEMNHKTNIYSGTYEEIREGLSLSKATVERSMVELQQIDFIRKYKNGRWMINPAVGIGCSYDYFNELMDRYYTLRPYIAKKERGMIDEN